jgi:hypothetical protein
VYARRARPSATERWDVEQVESGEACPKPVAFLPLEHDLPDPVIAPVGDIQGAVRTERDGDGLTQLRLRGRSSITRVARDTGAGDDGQDPVGIDLEDPGEGFVGDVEVALDVG